MLMPGIALALANAIQAIGPPVDLADTVMVPSGELMLRGLIRHPRGRGPFPAALFSHGGGPAPTGLVMPARLSENGNRLRKVMMSIRLPGEKLDS